jgi:hypothetical protein
MARHARAADVAADPAEGGHRSVVSPIQSPATNNCGMVLLPVRAASTDRICPPRPCI